MSNASNIRNVRTVVLGLIPQTILFMYVYYLVSLSVPFLAQYFWVMSLCYFIGEVMAILFYQNRIRSWIFVVVTGLLFLLVTPLLLYFFGGEFDTFVLSLRFRLMYFMLILGFIFNYILLRYRWGNVFFLLFTVTIAINFIMDIPEVEASTYLLLFGVLILLILAVFLISDLNNSPVLRGAIRWRYITATLITLFVFAFIYIFIGRESHLQLEQVEDIEHGFTDSSLIEKEDGRIQVKQEMSINPSNNNSKQLVFIAQIESFFGDDATPNPLYLTAYHYTRYDTATERFFVDSSAPDLEAFHPDMSKLAVSQSLIDSERYRELANRPFMHPVKVTVFNKALSPNEFIAPFSAYSVSKMPLTQEQSKEYSSSFVTYSMVSDWNSAYFVYNTFNAPQALLDFQEQRYAEIQKHSDYSQEPAAFMRYYTRMPEGQDFNQIRTLAKAIEKQSGAKTSLDKVLAVRDYFLSKDISGNYIYSYTDNPGEPGIPEKDRLNDFLFNTHKGYCAYFSGSGYFLLRAMGVPSRISVGFLTEDRSDKNRGWYWYYQNQAHAWVQVYFPEIGWLDFDFTIGNDAARRANQADGTPPVIPENPDFTARGYVRKMDSSKKSIELESLNYNYKGKAVNKNGLDLQCNLQNARILLDSTQISFSKIQKLDTLVIVSEVLDLGSEETFQIESKLEQEPILVDQAYLLKKQKENLLKDLIKAEDEDMFGNSIFKVFLLFLLLLLLSPILYLGYLFLRNAFSRKTKSQAYFNNLSMLFLTHQLGIKRGNMTNLEYAKNLVDPQLDTHYGNFMTKYLRLKYDPLYVPDMVESTYFRGYFAQELFHKIIPKLKIKNYLQILNPVEAINFIFKYYFI